MLRQLYIKNYALIDELDMDFGPGFSVITGETGAGKSIILGAIGLLLGQRADSKAVKAGTERCVIEAHFDLTQCSLDDFFSQNDIDADISDTIIRRELTAQGKSRAFICDTPVQLSQLKELGERLVDVHSQHQNLLLGKHDFQLGIVDVISQSEDVLSEYQKAWTDYQTAARRVETLRNEIEENSKTVDFLQFQYDELSSAKLVDGEQEELEQRSETMTHAEDIKQALFEAFTHLSADEVGVVYKLKKAMSALQSIAGVMPVAGELAERLNSSYIDLKDVSSELEGNLGDIEFSPTELDQVNARLDRINSLEMKYHVQTVAQLLALQSEVHQKLSNIENSDDALATLTAEAERLLQRCKTLADKLTSMRQEGAKQIDQQMRQRLLPLGMPHVRFETQIEEVELGRNGKDRIAFLFSANTSTPMQPVSQVASGGEIARVMLALKAMISGAVKLPTIIFDEIDTGVSGKIAEQMARIMAEMGSCGRQVVSITHLPQIAAQGTTHYKVYKDETAAGTTTHMLMLSDEERVDEIAQMLSGSNITEEAKANARQLLNSEK